MAAAAPAAPATNTYTGSTPGTAAFDAYQAQAEQAYNDATQQITDSRNQLLSASGVFENPANGGMPQGIAGADGSYQQMLQGNQQQHGSDEAAVGAMGFKGGLANKAMETSQQGAGRNALAYATGLAGNLTANTQQETSNTDNYQMGLVNEQNQEIANGIANGSYNPQNPGTPAPAPSPAPAPGSPGGGNGNGGGNAKGPKVGVNGVIFIQKGGKAVYGYGKDGTPFLTRAGAASRGRLGHKKPKGG